MSQFLSTMQHWIHQQPVAHVVWVCTFLAVVVLVFAVRPAIRRLRLRSDRAPRRILSALGLSAICLASLIWFDSGTRMPPVHLAKAESFSQFSQVLTAHSEPFSMLSYHTVNLSLSNVHTVLGVVPEQIEKQLWVAPRAGKEFDATLVGLPSDLRVDLFLNRSIVPEILHAFTAWEERLRTLAPSHVFIDAGTARRYGIHKGDGLQLDTVAGVSYWTVDAVIPRDALISGPTVVMSISDARRVLQTDSTVNTLVVYVTAQGSSARRAATRVVATHTSALGPYSASIPRLVGQIVRLSAVSPDWTRRLAVGATLWLFVMAVILVVLGRRRLTDNVAQSRT
jgi:hypothetical protein